MHDITRVGAVDQPPGQDLRGGSRGARPSHTPAQLPGGLQVSEQIHQGECGMSRVVW